MIDNLVAGLISGLVVILLVIVFREFWRKVVVSWFEERIYKDARIEGVWYSLYSAGSGYRQEVISLKRHGHEVTGTMVCIDGGEDVGVKYQVSGSFRNLILPLVYESEDRSKTDRGTITLKLVKNAECLEGIVALYHSKKGYNCWLGCNLV